MSTSVFVGNLPFRADEGAIAAFFEQAIGGPVVSVRLMTDRETGRSRGFGFCEFESHEMASRAVQNCNGLDFMGRQLRVDHSNPRH